MPPRPGQGTAPPRQRRPAPPAARPATAGKGRPARRRTGLHTTLAVVAVVAVMVGVALATGFLTPPASSSSSGPAGTARTVVRTGVGAFAAGGGELWVDDASAGTLRRVDPTTGATVGAVVRLGGRPGALAVADGRVWVADQASGSLVAVSTATHRTVGSPVPIGTDPISVVAAFGSVWVGDLAAGTVTAVDPRSGSVVATSALPDGVVRLVAGDGAVWATGQTDTLTRIAPHPTGVGLATRSVAVGGTPIGVAAGGGSVWTADLSGTLVQVSARSLRIARAVPLSDAATGAAQGASGQGAAGQGTGGQGTGGPETVALLGGRVWAATYAGTAVHAVDASTGRPAGTAVAVPGPVTELLAWDGSLWAATTGPARLLRISPS